MAISSHSSFFSWLCAYPVTIPYEQIKPGFQGIAQEEPVWPGSVGRLQHYYRAWRLICSGMRYLRIAASSRQSPCHCRSLRDKISLTCNSICNLSLTVAAINASFMTPLKLVVPALASQRASCWREYV